MADPNAVNGCVNCGTKCSNYREGRDCDKWTPERKMRKQVWIHCPNKCFEAMKSSVEITDESPVFIDLGTWWCKKCSTLCTLEMVDLENPKDFPMPDTTVPEEKETVKRGEQYERLKVESDKRDSQSCCSPRPKASDYVATESEKAETVSPPCDQCERKADCILDMPLCGSKCASFKPIPEQQEVPEEKTWPELVEMCRVLQKGFAEIIDRVSYIAKSDTVKHEEECEECIYEKGCDRGVCADVKPEREANMDFSNALKALKMGSKVKRVGWFKGLMVSFPNWKCKEGQLAFHTGEKQTPYVPLVVELEATDWMLHIE